MFVRLAWSGLEVYAYAYGKASLKLMKSNDLPENAEKPAGSNKDDKAEAKQGVQKKAEGKWVWIKARGPIDSLSIDL